ncbi:MAG: nucleoside triphosphate pyrophosphohydrolase, partial [Desulfobacteraceae bacterium]|nr:nucleoside triphosphate pyrophosphohydrolase [Desulfobacteraceae bacterium]
MNNENEIENERFFELKRIIKRLRAPDGCPWDREQTPESVTKYVVEEAYELIEAIREGDQTGACEELGDLFFMLLFVAQMYEERGVFSLADAMNAAAVKMI